MSKLCLRVSCRKKSVETLFHPEVHGSVWALCEVELHDNLDQIQMVCSLVLFIVFFLGLISLCKFSRKKTNVLLITHIECTLIWGRGFKLICICICRTLNRFKLSSLVALLSVFIVLCWSKVFFYYEKFWKLKRFGDVFLVHPLCVSQTHVWVLSVAGGCALVASAGSAFVKCLLLVNCNSAEWLNTHHKKLTICYMFSFLWSLHGSLLANSVFICSLAYLYYIPSFLNNGFVVWDVQTCVVSQLNPDRDSSWTLFCSLCR